MKLHEYDVSLTQYSEHDFSAVVDEEVWLAESKFTFLERPKAILLAGQPGAGKTVLSSMMLKQFHGNAAIINGDDYRRYHPNYRKLHEKYGSDAVALTSPFSNAVVERLIGEFSKRHFNLIIEGTGRTVDVPMSTADVLSKTGYNVELAVIAARPEISLISTLLRFYKMNEDGTIPRATAVKAHDYVVDVLPGNLDILRSCPNISKITIWDRERQCIYDSTVMTEPPSHQLKAMWYRPWSWNELEEAKKHVVELRIKEERYQLSQGTAIDALEKRLNQITIV